MENAKTASSNTTAKQDSPISKRAQEALHESVDAVADKASKAERSVRETAHRSAESLGETQDKIVKQWNGSEVRRFASENPVATVGIAFTAGMLLSSLLRRR
ncbi:DUF883 domain-containing protein [Paraglaciecola sp. 20A4]|uniref:DUF883 family protein n=1 Tax=Paraglaciecola sp. 20A4 TaxID=2687288 RepID=UPI00140AC051|nr:DUF883 domain-containing protein [Paraglaciecola sp. 20A4]